MRRTGLIGSKPFSISIAALVVLSVLLLTSTVCLADIRWTANGIQVRGAGLSNDAYSPVMVSDGSGNTIITWRDHRSGQDNIYAQKLNSVGTPQWAANGILIRGAGISGDAQDPRIAPDGSKGAIITWVDNRSSVDSYVYAQKVDSSGATRWTANGVLIRGSGAASTTGNPEITPDGSGGAIISWMDHRSVTVYDLYAQKVNSAGATQWTADGVMIRGPGLPNGSQNQKMVPDGSGGAIITWADGRSMAGQEIYAQRVLSNGTVQWLANGVQIRNFTNSGFMPQIIQGDSGSVIITWQDNRAGPTWSVYAQKVSSAGATQWTANGVGISASGLVSDPRPQIATDGSGGAVMTWVDDRSGQKSVYAIRIDAAGTPQWTANGVMIRGTGVAGDSYNPQIISDGSGGALVTWEDYRADPQWTIYSQKLSATGQPQWTANGIAIRGASVTGDAYTPRMVSDCYGGAVIAWEDLRLGKSDIYAQRMAASTPSWYLPEGTTAWGFDCYISVANPNATEVVATVTYMTDTGPVSGGEITLPARSQTTVLPRDKLGDRDFSTKIECKDKTKTIAVDRTMSWDTGRPSREGHCSVGVNAPAKTWYLPEGSSGWGFETWLLIQNPNGGAAHCDVTYMIEGAGPRVFHKTIPANSRRTFNMADDIGPDRDASIKVTSDVPVIPERAMYRYDRSEGHDSIGTTNPATDYYLAEGTTAWGFTTYVLVQNPNPTATDVTVTYMTPSGQQVQPAISLPANSRKTIRVNDALPNTDLSTRVHGSQPIIAERAMYWGEGTAVGEACHDSIGMDSAHKTFYLPDGTTGFGFETWTLVQNPNSSAVTVEVSYLKAGGGAVSLTASIPANSRQTFNMADKVASGRASIVVTCKTAGKKIMVERAMYWNTRGAGTDTIGGFTD